MINFNSSHNENVNNYGSVDYPDSFQDPLSLDSRCDDNHYTFLLYLCFKLGSLFDICINGNKIIVVSEDYSLSHCNSGSLQFIVLDAATKRKSKISDLLNWKQNGDENVLNIQLPSDLKCSKRNYTKIDSTIENENLNVWEYSLYQGNSFEPNSHYSVLLRHYLNDQSPQIKYLTSFLRVSIKSKSAGYYSTKSNFEIYVGDYNLVDTIYSFAIRSSITIPNQNHNVDCEIRNMIELNNN